ncbi:hypothetical protein N42_2475 [Lactococcus lactis subsp. lactis]|uniref:Uncharacterized protein n=1 Tax=Lactococcus lactis subsp. lactis TaxID=1360 RepID=A0A0V8EFB3_LACLL|nr:hypothetical protein N42_2475 [Lactococcus lactis subsp. lactis]
MVLAGLEPATERVNYIAKAINSTINYIFELLFLFFFR